jgi:hypothetical protein
MSTVAPPLALGIAGTIVIVAVVLLLVAGAYALLFRNDPRHAEVDAERERVSEEFPLGNPVDFQSEFRPPPDP